jgi:hypothetical protein
MDVNACMAILNARSVCKGTHSHDGQINNDYLTEDGRKYKLNSCEHQSASQSLEDITDDSLIENELDSMTLLELLRRFQSYQEKRVLIYDRFEKYIIYSISPRYPSLLRPRY